MISLTFHSNHRPISYRIWDKRRLENRKIFPAGVFCAPAEGVPLTDLGNGAGDKNQNDGATGPRKKFDDIFTRVDAIDQRDRQTDRRTDTAGDSKDRAYA